MSKILFNNLTQCKRISKGEQQLSDLVKESLTIYDALIKIKNDEYVMPSFQRQYVWSLEQIEKLWDSILLGYPIATFLFWHISDDNVSSDTYFCKFMREAIFNCRKQAESTNYALSKVDLNKTHTAVLDGQQRLTSLYLSLFGDAFIRQKHARKKGSSGLLAKLIIELDKHKVSIGEEEYNSKKYDIKYTDKIGMLSPTQFEVRKILNHEFQNELTREKAIEDTIKYVKPDSREYARNILKKLYNKIFIDKVVGYTNIKNTNQEDALEMFVRFNSGGKTLRKSEITMSILEAYWPDAKTKFGELLVGAYAGFSSDFIIRTALMLFGDVIKSNINKQIADNLKNNWCDFKKALENLEDVLNQINIDVSRFSSSWNVLLPIIYLVYNNTLGYKKNIQGIKAYLIRAVLFTYFQSGTTNKLQEMKRNISDYNYEITIDMLNQIKDLRIKDSKIEDILNAEKGSKIAGEALYYLSLEWLDKENKYEQDHLHPVSRFNKAKPSNVSVEEWKRWYANKNKLANLQLLKGKENASKNDVSLKDYYSDMKEDERKTLHEKAMIPNAVSLDFDNFAEFYDKRKEILSTRLKKLLS